LNKRHTEVYINSASLGSPSSTISERLLICSSRSWTVTPLIQTQMTNRRDPLPQKLKDAITLRHLATGDSYLSLSSLSFNFRCGMTSITRIIPQVCRAIALSATAMRPSSWSRGRFWSPINADLVSPINWDRLGQTRTNTDKRRSSPINDDFL